MFITKGPYRAIGSFNGSPPKTLEEFLNYIKTDGRTEYQLLQAGTVVLVLNVRPSSNQVIAYEKHVYEKWNNRLVAFGDRVELMQDDEFRKIFPNPEQ